MSQRALTLAGYAAIASGAVVYQSVTWVRHSLTLGRFVRWLIWGRARRVLFLLGWAWLGWHLFARGNATFPG